MKRRSSRKQPAKLSYGNQDLSKWDGKETSSDLSGFWLESSLKITPVEQVQVLDKIFDQSEVFSQETIAMMKGVMHCEEMGRYQVYGKTGTGNNNAWFVGFFEDEEKCYYFATHLSVPECEQISGLLAKQITKNVIVQYW